MLIHASSFALLWENVEKGVEFSEGYVGLVSWQFIHSFIATNVYVARYSTATSRFHTHDFLGFKAILINFSYLVKLYAQKG